jgi:two-component system, OmpR family, sensor histidine kinase TctE
MTPVRMKGAAVSPGPSLRRQLLLWLLLPQLVLWLVAGVLGYRIALNYAEKGVDQSLSQTVRSLARQVKPLGSGLLIDFPRAAQDILEQDPNDRVSYMVSSPPGRFVLGNGQLPQPPQGVTAASTEPQLYQANVDGKPVRVAMLELDYGDEASPQRLRVQVAKSLAVQDRIAKELIADMLVPLLVLGALISMLVYAGIRRGLRPLQRLEAQLQGRSGQSLTALAPIEMTEAPLEVHSLAAAVNLLLTAVRRSVSQEKRFLSDAAHQLRTPLAGLISQTELALQEADPEARQARLGKVLAGAERSAHLVHQLLALARTEAEVALQPLDLAALAREVARQWTPRALAKKMDLGFEGEQHLQIRGEALLLQEALSNLLDNALQYAGEGALVTVRVYRLAKMEGWAVLEVEDTGAGLATPDPSKAFERFWRGADIPGGCGLGLAIVSEIALRHGGSASAHRVVPHGFCIQLQLPSALVQASPIHPASH